MAATKRDVYCSTLSGRFRIVFLLYLAVALLSSMAEAGGHHGHGQGGMDQLLAAGLLAKVLSKGGHDGGGGGGGEARHQYMPIPIPLHSGGGGGGGGHHHHVHHKYVPIPVKHHTNFIIAHHKVPVPVHIPVPVVKTKVVHVPVEKTKIVPIIVHKGHHSHPHYSSPYGPSPSSYRTVKGRTQAPSASTAAGALTALASSGHDGQRQVRITSLGTVRKLKDQVKNGTTGSALQFKRPSSRAPDKWIVVVKNKRRPSTTTSTIRRITSSSDSMTADSKVIPRVAVPANSTAISTAGPRR